MSGGFWCFSCSCWPLSHRRWAFSEKLARMASAKRNIVVLVWDQKKIKDLAWTGVAGTYFCDFLWVNDGKWWPHEGVIADFSSVFSPLSPGWDCLRQGRWPSQRSPNCQSNREAGPSTGAGEATSPLEGWTSGDDVTPVWLQDQNRTTTSMMHFKKHRIGITFIGELNMYIYPTESRSTNIEQYIYI